MSAAAAPILRFNGVYKRFGGTVAVNDVSFELHRGEIVALLGENGAGKSTLIKILAGVHAADAGSIDLAGETLTPGTTVERRIAFIHQDLGLIEWMTVAENIGLNGNLAGRFGLISWPALRRHAREALARVGGNIDPEERIFNLSRTDKSLVAIARALMVDAQVLVLDEPTSSLPTADVARLFDVLHRLRDSGVAMIYVSHRLDEIPQIADRVVVMRDGRLIGVREVGETTTEGLITMIVGRAVVNRARPPRPDDDAAELLSLQALVVGDVGPVSLTLQSGEILALTGLQGAGHTTVGRALFGLFEETAGDIRLAGQAVSIRTPAEAISRGLGFTSSNRREEGLATSMSVLENLLINPGVRGRSPLALTAPAGERRTARALIERFDIQPPDPVAIMDTLSGGNQQKVVLARWFHCDPQILILEEPTLGVDVGAKGEIYATLAEMVAAGKAVLLVSSDFEEVANVAQRALVLKSGRVAGELHEDDISIARLTEVAAG